MAWNIPLPAGTAGASPQTLAAAGQTLGQMMQPGGMPDINTLAAGGGGYLYPSDYLLGIGMQEEAGTTRFTAQEQRLLYEFDEGNRITIEEAQLAYKQAIEVASLYAGSYSEQAQATVAAAMAHAQAAIEAANISAAASRYDSDTKLKIATMTVDLERQRIAAVELARPGDWIARAGFFRGQTPEQSKALQQFGGGTVFTPQAATQAPSALPALPTAPSAIVGEAGPELATATPQGAQITPLGQQQAQWLRGKGMQGMQFGGYISGNRAIQGKAGGIRGGTGEQAWSRDLAKTKAITQGPEALSGREYQMLAQGHYLPGGPSSGTYENPFTTMQQQLQGLTAGTSGGAAYPTTTTTPAAAGAVSPVDQLPFLQFARAGGQLPVPSFQEWTGPTTLPQAGINEPIPPPWNYNIVQFQNMARPEQAMLAGAWRSLGMIAGQTEEEMIANAMESMQRSAWRGAALPMTAYGG